MSQAIVRMTSGEFHNNLARQFTAAAIFDSSQVSSLNHHAHEHGTGLRNVQTDGQLHQATMS